MIAFKKIAQAGSILILVFLAASCQMMSLAPAGPAPGTVGFYDYNASVTKIATEDMKVTRLSIPGDRVFVYRVNDDMIVLGAGDPNANAKIKPLDEVSTGVVITPESAKKLSAYLEKITAQYNIKDKKVSQYQDFRILTTGTVVATVAEKDIVAPVDTIVLRVQYVYNMVEIENAELTLCYFGGSSSGALKELKINEISALITSLQKI
jgi:hypothetical protein